MSKTDGANNKLNTPTPQKNLKGKAGKWVVHFVVVQLRPAFCDPMDCSMPGFPVLHSLLEFAQTHFHWLIDAIQPSHLLLPPSPLAPNLSQHQGLFQWVGSSHQVAKVLELQLQISPSSECSGLISFRIDWLDLLAILTRGIKEIRGK